MPKPDYSLYQGHSRGDWTESEDGYTIRIGTDGRIVAYTGPHHTPPEQYPESCRREDLANGRLIRDAPKLLARCLELEQQREKLAALVRDAYCDGCDDAFIEDGPEWPESDAARKLSEIVKES